MNLNTNELLGKMPACGEVTTGLTFQRLEGFEGDYTKEGSLIGSEVDKNFYNLKAQDIKSGETSGTTIILTRWNGESLELSIDTEELQHRIQLLEDSQDDIMEELSAITTEIIQYATKEWVKSQGYLTSGDTAGLLTVDDLMLQMRNNVELNIFLRDWLDANLKTINCQSLVGCGNIMISCGEGGETITFALEAGDAIDIKSDDVHTKTNIISVKVSDSIVKTTESIIDNHDKNFLHINQSTNSLEINGIDADKVYITDNIKIDGTQFADMAIADKLFEGNIIPSGMSVQEVIYRLFNKEAWSSIKKSITFSPNRSILIKMFDQNGNEITDKSKIKFGDEITFVVLENGIPSQSAVVTGFKHGYKTSKEGEIISQSQYSMSLTPELIKESDDTIVIEGLEKVLGKDMTYKVGYGRNRISISRNYDFKPQEFNEVKLYDISNKGSVSEDHMATISGDDFVEKHISVSSSISFDIVLPLYYGGSEIIHTFNGESFDSDIMFLMNECNSKDTEIVDEFRIQASNGYKQLLFAIRYDSKMNYKCEFGDDKEDVTTEDTDLTETRTKIVKINNADYLVWTLTMLDTSYLNNDFVDVIYNFI